ncbi:hypothetical protein C8Q73DRAFT_789684 [Cubamyces lactineus]|nr:hypothetical protein C8Q73DRAFT_789684 [Cubamyces lactineus]
MSQAPYNMGGVRLTVDRRQSTEGKAALCLVMNREDAHLEKHPTTPELYSTAINHPFNPSAQSSSSPTSTVMQFKLAILATTLAATLSPALAASCYSASGCQSCETETSMYNARQTFCGSDSWSTSSSLSWGQARVVLANGFATQQECFDGFANIISDCYGKRDGGVYTYSDSGHDARLDVDFCSCE